MSANIITKFSGITDVNGVEINEGDLVRLTINQQYAEPLVFTKRIVFRNAAFRFDGEGKYEESCIGDIGCNCTIEVIDEY